MYKVIVERPRRGGAWTKPGRPLRDPDDGPAHEGMQYRLGWSRKWLNENLRPLERWLERQVGRPWAAVYSELCRQVDRRNTVQQHIHQHLRDFVETDVRPGEDGFYVLSSWGGMIALADSRCDLYVDPRNGWLMRNDAAFVQRARRRREHRLAVHARQAGWREGVRDISEHVQLHRLDGIWYRVELAPVPPPRRSRRKPETLVPAPAFDAVLHAQAAACEGRRRALYGRYGVYALRKRQLSQTELAAHRLRNGDDPDPFVPDAHKARTRKRSRGGAHRKEH